MSEQPPIETLSASPTILVVDDDLALTKLCKRILEEAGFTVLHADGSSDALKLCTQHEGPIDLLLTDLVLPPPGFQLASSTNQFPHVHGHELAVRAIRIRKGLRVILMSGNVEQELAGYGIRRETLPFIPKPFEPQTLVSLVNQTLHAPAPLIESLTEKPPGLARPSDEWVG
ncbi:MAG: response regulator [Nitrospirota bacterium]|nr:response regulator [Nitrospirota bacterium]MDP2382430.1 response regulator [Nitrospirota bacterium]MDP3599000.1 response regulator [Nitrospirota bacterium]